MTNTEPPVQTNDAGSDKGIYFISYSRESDRRFAVRLQCSLAKVVGRDNVWRDEEGIPPGARFEDEIRKTLEDVRTVLVILSPASVASRWVNAEISVALKMEKDVVPVIHRRCVVPLPLEPIEYIDLRYAYEAGVKTILERKPPPPPFWWVRLLRKTRWLRLSAAVTILSAILIYSVWPSMTSATLLDDGNRESAISILLENHGPKPSIVTGPYSLKFGRLPIIESDLERVDQRGHIVPSNGELEIALSKKHGFTPQTLPDGSARSREQIDQDLRLEDVIELNVGVKESNQATTRLPVAIQSPTIRSFVIPRLPQTVPGAKYAN